MPSRGVAILFYHSGKVLSVSRKDDHLDFGLPGGSVEPGETFVEAALRETREEIGVEALKMHRVFCHPCLAGREVVTFQVAEYEGTPRPMEGAAVDWVYPAVLLKPHCSFREYNTALFRHLGILVTLDEFRLAYLDYVEGVQPEPKFESLSVSDQDRASRWIRSLAAVCGVDPTAQRPSTEDLLAKSDRDR